VQFLNSKRRWPKETKKIIKGSLVLPPSVEDQTKWEKKEEMKKIVVGSPMMPPSSED